MPQINSFAKRLPDIAKWRQDFHRHPELQFDVFRTAETVEMHLKSFGCDQIKTKVGRTGVVGVIKGRTDTKGRVIALRADMDALPIHEATGLDYASTIQGKMHACGHDGHTSMLLGAAEYLCDTRNFDGTVVVLFQPAEEGGGGGHEMVNDGVMEEFGIQEVYGLHNMPNLPLGQFMIKSGPFFAAADLLEIKITGKGGHAARPHIAIDTTLVASQIVVALQSVVSRNTDPLQALVVSITSLQTDTDAFNVLPEHATIKGTVRTLNTDVQDMAEAAIHRIIQNTAAAYGAKVDITYKCNYPVMSNHEEQTAFAARVAADVVGPDNVDTNAPSFMGAEDFAFMLNARPGAYICMGNGQSAPLHHPEYNFNDEAIPIGCSYWARLVEMAMPLN